MGSGPFARVPLLRACSSARLERTPDKREVGSSSLPRPTTLIGGVAQLGERLLCKQEVIGSIPFASTNFWWVVGVERHLIAPSRRR